MPSLSPRVVVLSCFSTDRTFRSLMLTIAVIAFGFPSINSPNFNAANQCLAQENPASEELQPDLKKSDEVSLGVVASPKPRLSL